MELVFCPACQGFSAPGSKVCEHCKAAIPEDAEPMQTIRAAPVEEPPPPPETAEEPAPEEPAGPPALEGPPELLAKVDGLEAAIEKEPASKTPYVQLSQLYADAKRFDLAAATLERFLAVDPSNAYVKHRLSQVVAKRDGKTSAAAATPTATPVAAAAPAKPSPPANKTSATIPPRQAYSAAALAQRPAAPVIRREFQGMNKQRKLQIAAAVGVLALAVLVKMYVFPGTRRLVAGDFRAFAPAFSPTGGHIAFLLSDAQSLRLAVYDMRKGAYTPLAPVSDESFAWSPDGTRIAYTASGSGDDWSSSVSVVEVATGQARKVAKGRSPVWSGGGSLIIQCSPEPPRRESFSDEPSVSFSEGDWGERFCRAEVATGSVQRLGLAPNWGMTVSGSVESVVYEQVREDPSAAMREESPKKDFDQLIERATAGNARNLGEGSRDLNRELEARRYQERRKALGKTQKLGYEADVIVASIDGGTPTQLTSGGRSGLPSWTHDGRVLYASDGAAGLEIWSMTAQGADKKAVLRGAKLEDPSTVQLTRDGRYVFFVSPVEGDPGLAKMMTGEEPADIHYAPVGEGKPTRLANQHPFKHRFAVSPDGKLVAYEVLQDIKLIGGAQKSELWLVKR